MAYLDSLLLRDDLVPQLALSPSAQKAAFSLLAVAAFALVLVLVVTMTSDRRPPRTKVQTIYNVPFYDSVQTIRRLMSRWLASVATAENQKA